MPRQKFDLMADLESHHWWFVAKRRLVAAELDRVGLRSGVAIDVGCGTGEVVDSLKRTGFAPVVGTDLSRYALALASRQHADDGTRFLASRAERLPLRADSVRCLTSLDVIEHLDDDVAALVEYGRLVGTAGLVVIAVPAYVWAWSEHDVVLGHRRRYTRQSLVEAAQTAGLTVHRCTYFHSWLVPIAFALRRTPLRHLVRREAEEASYVGPRVNRILTALSSMERTVLRRFDLPVGLSILLVAGHAFERSRLDVRPDPSALEADS
jgi:ubiquinone/menaquinone biosynthesis C-methylase UbiE